MTSEGQQLKIKNSSSLKVEFPKVTNEDMTLFYGKRDSLGQMNWISTSESFKSNAAKKNKNAKQDYTANKIDTASVSSIAVVPVDRIIDYLKSSKSTSTLTEKEKEKIQKEIQLNQKVYDAINLKSFGWINCDKFQSITEKADLIVNIDPKDNISYASVFLIFKDINSIMQYYYLKDKQDFENSFRNIPIGYRVKLVAYSIKGEQILTYSENILIKENGNLTIKLKPTTVDEFKSLMSGS